MVFEIKDLITIFVPWLAILKGKKSYLLITAFKRYLGPKMWGFVFQNIRNCNSLVEYEIMETWCLPLQTLHKLNCLSTFSIISPWFDLIYLKVTANEVLVLFLLAFCFQVLIYVSPSRSYIYIFWHSALKIERAPENVFMAGVNY